MEQCQQWPELRPLMANLDLMLPWLDGWGVDQGAQRVFLRLHVHTQERIWEDLQGNLGNRPAATLMNGIRRAQRAEGLVEPINCEISVYPNYSTDDVRSISQSLAWLDRHDLDAGARAVFLSLAPTCRRCMHPRRGSGAISHKSLCAAPTQERIRSMGGLGLSGRHDLRNQSAMLMTRVKQALGWKSSTDDHRSSEGPLMITDPARSDKVEPVWGWFDSPALPDSAEGVGLGGPYTSILEEWRPEALEGHGMMSIFSMGIAKLKQASRDDFALAINIQEQYSLYASFNPEGNIWLDYFLQPHEVSHGHLFPLGAAPTRIVKSKIQPLTSAGIWGHASISQTAGTVYDARELVARFVRLQPDFQTSVHEFAQKFFKGGQKYLAIHVRLTDKSSEASQNFELKLEDMVQHTKQAALDFGDCQGVFLCTDDQWLKNDLADALQQEGFDVCRYPSLLSDAKGKATHFDRTVDARTKTSDIWHEVVLMARFCHGLVSTFSNVSTMTVYLAPHEYPHRDFWHKTLPATSGDRHDDEWKASRKKRKRGGGGAGGGGVDAGLDADTHPPNLHWWGPNCSILCIELLGEGKLERDAHWLLEKVAGKLTGGSSDAVKHIAYSQDKCDYILYIILYKHNLLNINLPGFADFRRPS
jgi:hypothetical protein